MKIDYSGWLYGGLVLSPKGGAGVIPAVIADENSVQFSNSHFYMKAQIKSRGLSENAYITMYGDFDFSTEKNANNSNLDSYFLATDNFGSVLLDNMKMDIGDMLDNPNALKKKWLIRSNEIIGTSAKDKINAYKGDDVIFGGGGKDKITGGNGNDYLDGGGEKDILKGNRGDDTFVVRYDGSVVIKDFDIDDDFIKIQGASLSDISVERSKRFTYIEDSEGHWIAKLNGAPDLSNAVFL
jgi:hypothetical protein